MQYRDFLINANTQVRSLWPPDIAANISQTILRMSLYYVCLQNTFSWILEGYLALE